MNEEAANKFYSEKGHFPTADELAEYMKEEPEPEPKKKRKSKKW